MDHFTRDSENIVCVNIPHCSPEVYSIDDSKCGEIKVSWKVVEGATGYNVYRAVPEGGCPGGLHQRRKIAKNISHCLEELCSYIDKKILADVNYHYWVSALSGAGESPLSYMGSGKSIYFYLPPTQ